MEEITKTPQNFFTSKQALGLAVAVVFLVAVFFVYRTNSTSTTEGIVPVAIDKQAVFDKKLMEHVKGLTVESTPDTSEFYKKTFSSQYQDAYLNYRKGGIAFTYGNETDEQQSYWSQALTQLAGVYNNTSLPKEERAYALNVMNAIYIGTSWDDTFMTKSLYTISPFKEMYEKNAQELKTTYPYLENAKDVINRHTQTALMGAASQITMSQINKLSYDLYSVGYPLMRSRMNKMTSDGRIYMLDPKNKDKDMLTLHKDYLAKEYGEQGILSLKKQLENLDTNKMLFEGVGSLSQEIYMMRTVVVWDPLISFADSESQKLAYHKLMMQDFKKAASLSFSTQRGSVITMIHLFYVAALVDYGITKQDSLLTQQEKNQYKEDAILIVNMLIDSKYKALDNYVTEGEGYSHIPASYPEGKPYYGGSPYYQLRVLAQHDEKIKTYLTSHGWKF